MIRGLNHYPGVLASRFANAGECQIKQIRVIFTHLKLYQVATASGLLEIRDRGFEPRYGIKVSEKENVSSLLARDDSILWEPP